jgi:hypothetical protein
VAGTYASFALILIASALVGQGLMCLCGCRRPAAIGPAVGLALICALAWGTVRLPGHGTAAAIAVGLAALAGLAVVRVRMAGPVDALRLALPVGALATLAASIPFLVEGRFGILGTGLDPDMSQHLFAADRLATGGAERLADSGYPLGPHSVVVAATKVSGASLVHGFDGLTLAIAVCAAIVPLALFAGLSAWRRIVACLLVGLPYMVASYLIQGAFKETIEALFVLAFAVGLHRLQSGTLVGDGRGRSPAAGIPLAALAIGAVYAYSFPGLLWLGGAALVWVLVARPRRLLIPGLVAIAVLAVAAAPEIGRMVDFASFETFNPSGAGLGNLFNRISPLEALGVWPSGDFRLDPGDGAMPAIGYYLGSALALAALVYGSVWWARRRALAAPAALAVAAALIVYALVAGTPYQEAKAIAIAAPLAMLVAVGAIAEEPLAPRLRAALAAAFVLAAGGCSLLALANGPVGPTSWTPALTELRHELGRGSTLVLAPAGVLDAHGSDFLAWELRGGRLCFGTADQASSKRPPHGVAQVVAPAGRPPYAHLRLERQDGPYSLWAVVPAPTGPGPCTPSSAKARANPA